MKHYLKNFSLIVTLMMAFFAVTACGSDDDDKKDAPDEPKTLKEQLVGVWTEINLEEGEAPFILTLNANQSGSLKFTVDDSSRLSITSTQNFKWDCGTTANGENYLKILTTGGDTILDDGNYMISLIGDDLSFSGIRFKRR